MRTRAGKSENPQHGSEGPDTETPEARRLGMESRAIRLASPGAFSHRSSRPAPSVLFPSRPFGASSFSCQIGAEMNLEIVGIAQELRAQIKTWVGELQPGAPRGEWLGGYSPPSTSSMAIVCTFARTSPAEIGG